MGKGGEGEGRGEGRGAAEKQMVDACVTLYRWLEGCRLLGDGVLDRLLGEVAVAGWTLEGVVDGVPWGGHVLVTLTGCDLHGCGFMCALSKGNHNQSK